MDTTMKEKTYRVYIAVFFIAIFLFLFFSVITFKQINDLITIQNEVERTYEVQQKTQLLLADLINAETGQRGFLLTRDSSFLEPYQMAESNIDNHLDQLTKLTEADPVQQTNTSELQILNNWRLQYLTDVLDDYAPEGYITNFTESKMYRGKRLMDSCRDKLIDIKNIEFAKLQKKQEKSADKIRSASIFALVAMLVSLLIILVAFYKIDYDLSKMRRILKNLDISNSKLITAQEAGNMGQWVWNITKKEIVYSDQHYRQLGYEPGDYPHKVEAFFEMILPEDIDAVTKIGEKILAKEIADRYVYRIRKKDGSIAHLVTKYNFIEDENGDTLAIGANLDMTKDVKHAQDLEFRNESLIKANNELSSFNYIASHDLQEPLRKIQMFISRIDSDDETTISGRSEQFFDKIKNAANRMQVLINDLLAFSRLNKTDKVMEPLDMNILFENIREEWMQSIEDKNAEIIVHDMPKINGVPFLIQTLFSNLIGNSLKYSVEKRKPVIKIEHKEIGSQKVKAYHGDAYKRFHCITIKDNGIGFENEYAEKIFELFQRLHGKNTFAGTGIGLAICKKIVESHDGFIEASGKPNEGAVFTVYLPVDS